MTDSLKIIILAGGLGTRISEESQHKPKPMIHIGDNPIIWHIMKGYSHYGYNEFIICAGYKQNIIKEYFANYALFNSDITFEFGGANKMKVNKNISEPWKVTVVDTGYKTLTGGRLKKAQSYIGENTFMLTYGDGVSNVNIDALVKFHRSHGKLCTVTTTKPESRFGYLDLDGNKVLAFREKSKNDVGYINIGYMVMEQGVFEYIKGDEMLEAGALERMAADGEVMAFKHEGFWQCMDTLRDKMKLEKLWDADNAPWKVW